MHAKLQADIPAGEYMSKEQLDFFQQLLISKNNEVEAGIEQARFTLANLGNAADTIDKAAIEEDRQALSRTLERLHNQHLSIRYSLKSISDGEYGWCEFSGEEIGLERLLAQPTARYSAAVQAQRESVSRHYAAA